ncbi:hypothetical protein DFH07DRAFT_765445 [Mycena maculata]|uniref:Oxidase ustYa n=1 Tax=Mycena maculata TaxID=230809 RepID=A0AAD7K7V1_9AGAR|nr:hypothetical protein DFH07DRAFT_765445 [Mycena maculata]
MPWMDHSQSTSRYARPLRLAAVFCMCGIVVVAVAQGIINITRRPMPSVVQLYPGTSPVWDLGPLDLVRMAMEDTANYQLASPDAGAQWASMIPKNGGIVHVGPDRQPYMLSVFHQLKCLDIMRRMYAEDHGGALDDVGRHCLNYLRQTLLCRSDLRLETVQDPDGAHAVDMYGDLTCSDWRQVYARVEENERLTA